MLTKDAINYFGSKAKLAKALGVSQPAVSRWGVHIPEKRAARLWDAQRRAGISDKQIISGDDATASQGHERGHSGKWQRIHSLGIYRGFIIFRAH